MLTRHNRPLRPLHAASILAVLTTVAIPLTVAAAASATAGSLVVNSEEKSGICPLGRDVVFAIKPAGGDQAVDLEEVAIAVTRDGLEKVALSEPKRNGGVLEVRFTPEAAGWPMPVSRDVESEHAKKVIEAIRYCDNVNLATRPRAETLVFVGLVDTTCSPPGVFAAYNNLRGNKRIVAYPHKPHNGLPKEDT